MDKARAGVDVGKGFHWASGWATLLKPECTPGDHRRVLSRGFDEEFLERVRTYRHTEPYRKALRKRKVWVEPMFTEAKEWHGMRRFRLRTLRRVNIEAMVIAAAQNTKRLLAFRGRGPSSLAQAAALRLPAPTLSSVVSHLPRNQRVGDPEHSSQVFQHADPFHAVCKDFGSDE